MDFYPLQIASSLMILIQSFNITTSTCMSLYMVFMGKNELIVLSTILQYFLK